MRLWATANAVAWLRVMRSDTRDEWQLLEEKAIKYLKKGIQQLQFDSPYESFIDAAKELQHAEKVFIYHYFLYLARLILQPTMKAEELELNERIDALRKEVTERVEALIREIAMLAASKELRQLQAYLLLEQPPTPAPTFRPMPRVEEVD
mgnify:CR=1 FL=1